MPLDLVELALVERTPLGQDRHRHGDLPDVVQQAAQRRERDVRAVQAGGVRKRERHARDARRVLGVGRDLGIQPARELEQPRKIDALSLVHPRMIDQVCGGSRPPRQ